jgi:hypothetical protein
MEDNDHPLPPHERHGHTKEKFLKFRDGTRKFTWNGLEIPHIGRYGKNGFKDFGCTSSILA